MSKLSNFNEFLQSYNSETSSQTSQQLLIESENSLSVEQNNSNSSEHSCSENLENVFKNNNNDNYFKLSSIKSINYKYPLTEKSKRDMAAKIQMERKNKSEQIKKINEKMSSGAEIIKVLYYCTSL